MRHPHDTFEVPDGRRVRMMRDQILVQLDPTQDRSTSGLIHFPEGAMEHVMQTGTIKAFGFKETRKGVRIPIPDLGIGLKCVFIRFRKEQHTNLLLRKIWGDDHIVLEPSDLLAVYDAEDHARVGA